MMRGITIAGNWDIPEKVIDKIKKRKIEIEQRFGAEHYNRLLKGDCTLADLRRVFLPFKPKPKPDVISEGSES